MASFVKLLYTVISATKLGDTSTLYWIECKLSLRYFRKMC